MKLLTSAALAALVIAAPASALTFHWTFSNLVVGGIDATVGGTVEVEEGVDVAATSVVLNETSNAAFNSLIGFDFTTLSTFENKFIVVGGEVLVAWFATDWTANSINLSLEYNTEDYGSDSSENLGLITTAGNPFDVCPAGCAATVSDLTASNAGHKDEAPAFTRVTNIPVPASAALILTGFAGLAGLRRRA